MNIERANNTYNKSPTLACLLAFSSLAFTMNDLRVRPRGLRPNPTHSVPQQEHRREPSISGFNLSNTSFHGLVIRLLSTAAAFLDMAMITAHNAVAWGTPASYMRHVGEVDAVSCEERWAVRDDSMRGLRPRSS